MQNSKLATVSKRFISKSLKIKLIIQSSMKRNSLNDNKFMYILLHLYLLF